MSIREEDAGIEGLRAPVLCRHITYIQSSFLAKTLKLEESEVFDQKKHACYIPTCPGRAVDDLKQFFHVGEPPMKTYYPVNYIGIGLHNANVDTQGWYPAYVPLNLKCFDNDIYNVNRALIRIADGGKLWLPAKERDKDRSGCRENTQQDYGDHDEANVFMSPYQKCNDDSERGYIFATPSCVYATMNEMASVLSFTDLPVCLRIVVEVLVRPLSYHISCASIPNVDANLDCCFSNDVIEWSIASTEDVIPQRLLFRILKKETGKQQAGSQSEREASKIPVGLSDKGNHTVGLIAIMPSSNVLFVNENNFQSLREIYNPSSREDSLTFQEVDAPTTSMINQESYAGVAPNFKDGTPERSPLRRYDWDEKSPLRTNKATSSVGPRTSNSDKEPQFLNLKLKWTEHNNKVVFYLKSLINPKWLQWNSTEKLWRVERIFMYECVKYAIFLGLKVSDKVLFALWSWLKSIDMRGVGEIFSRVHMINWVGTSKIWSFQRVNITVVPGYNPSLHKDLVKGLAPSMQEFKRENCETVEIEVLPFNKNLLAKFKERNKHAMVYVWDKTKNTWMASQLKATLEDLLQVIPSLKESCSSDTYLSSRGINLRDLNRAEKRAAHGHISVPLKRANRDTECASDEENEFTTVTKMVITAAGKVDHFLRIKEKIKTVIEKVGPPTSSISASGKIIQGGAGTAGIEFVETPRGPEEWNKVSFCVVPDEFDGELPVEEYDPNILASLIAEVFIVKESAIDYLLKNFSRWPGPQDTVSYERWNAIIIENEARCWGGHSFDVRQKLAQTRLFCDEDFFIPGSNQNGDAMLCRLLIQLGNGKLVGNAKDAEYVIITDRTSEEAQELNRLYGKNDEDLIAKTHGARHSTLVTPKFIYDCILQWKLQRPTRSHGHLAF